MDDDGVAVAHEVEQRFGGMGRAVSLPEALSVNTRSVSTPSIRRTADWSRLLTRLCGVGVYPNPTTLITDAVRPALPPNAFHNLPGARQGFDRLASGDRAMLTGRP